MNVKIQYCFIALLLIILSAGEIDAKEISVDYDENVELMSIISRLAKFNEYNHRVAGNYDNEIDSTFATFKEHPAVKFLQQTRTVHNCAYDAIMSMAVRLERNGSSFRIIEEEVDELDRRWKDVDKKEFLRLIGMFYKDTNFEHFFEIHRTFYEKGIEDYKLNVMKGINVDWYEKFYGFPPVQEFRVIIAFVNGHHNYGSKRNKKSQPEEVFNITGYCSNQDGQSVFDKSFQTILIHEFNHSFINYLLNGENEKKLQDAGQYIFKTTKWTMGLQNYKCWQTMINESLVRAAVIRYIIDNETGNNEIENSIFYEIERGFRWMPELVCLMGKYERKRYKYPTFASFYSEIIKFFVRYQEREHKRFDNIM